MVTSNNNTHWSYTDALHLLNTTIPFYQQDGKTAYKPDLSKAFKLAEFLSNPHQKFKSIHVGGTNGKGSVSHILASVLQQAGLKTGLYTSPHLLDFRDRIKINGSAISKKEVTFFIKNNAELFKSHQASFFEVTTIMAFDHFARHKVDYAIIEVGLGGRLDTTNIINPEISIITNINLDHTDILGKNITNIAKEKAGIIKKQVPVIIGETHPESALVFKEKANKEEAPLLFADQTIRIKKQTSHFPSGQDIRYELNKENIIDLQTDLNGHYQQKNIATSLATLQQLDPGGKQFLNNMPAMKGFGQVQKNTGLLGRMQLLSTKPYILCDVAHNPDGLKPTMDQLITFNFDHLHMVLGTVQNKPLNEIFSLFPPKAKLYLAPLNLPRTEKLTLLEMSAENSGHQYESFDSIWEAYQAARQAANKSDLVFIGGSNFAVAEILQKIPQI